MALSSDASAIRLQMEAFESENAMLDAFVEAVRALDPDILVGFEIQQGSLGYLVDRASTLERPDPLLRQLSRTPQVRHYYTSRDIDFLLQALATDCTKGTTSCEPQAQCIAVSYQSRTWQGD